ncbi:Protein-lysine N-methyltransferase efm5, partial [Spiromyces aspiralis]
RGKADLVVRKATGQPIIRRGGHGRQSWNGSTATVFGCSGFLGRYLVTRLAATGTRVVLPYRGEPDAVRHLKLTGDLGMVTPLEFDVRNPEQIEACVRHSDIVYNLIGRNYETKNFTFEQVHIEAPTRIAEICDEVGVSRLVHVSHIGAKGTSDSRVMQTKALGENSVKAAYPSVTIVRPATMYGYEDRLLNGIAYWRNICLVPNAKQVLRPVNVSDVASALHMMQNNEDTAGQTFELYGPKEYTYQQIIDICSFLLHEKVASVSIPASIYRLMARMLDLAPFHYTSHHEADMLHVDEIPSSDPS